MRGTARIARLAKRTTVPAACFGTGYVCCWAQGREETGPQIIASGVTTAWTGLMRGVRQLGRLVPDSQDGVLRAKLAQVEATELRWLKQSLSTLAEKGLDCKLLRYVILRQLCLCAQEDISGVAVQALVEGDADGSSGKATKGLAELAAFIDASAAEVAGTASAEELAVSSAGLANGLPLAAALVPLAGALHAIVEHGGASWHKELDCIGVLHVARATAIASSWLAVSQRSASSQQDPALSAEEESEVVSDLSAVWKALGQKEAHAFIRSVPRRSPEAAKLHADLEKRFAALQAAPQPPSASASRPAKDFIPQKLRGSMMVVMRGSLASSASVAPVSRPAAAFDTPEAPSGFRRKLGRILEYAAWGVLMGGAIVAISADGVGIFKFHVVPEQWRAPLQALVQQRAVRVEELLAKYDPPENPPTADLGARVGSWDAEANYIQPNFHGAVSQQS